MSPRLAKVKALIDMPPPTSKKLVQKFLGAAGYFSRYIPNYADIAAPLTNLLCKAVPFAWSDNANSSLFERNYGLVSCVMYCRFQETVCNIC